MFGDEKRNKIFKRGGNNWKFEWKMRIFKLYLVFEKVVKIKWKLLKKIGNNELFILDFKNIVVIDVWDDIMLNYCLIGNLIWV